MFRSRRGCTFVIGLLLAAATFALTACGSGARETGQGGGAQGGAAQGSSGQASPGAGGGAAPGGTQTYKMGVAMPQTGNQSGLGLDFVRYIEMGVEDANRKYAAEGIQIEMAVEDTQATAEVGVTALNKLATVAKVPVVFTAWSSVVKAMAPVAQDLKVLVVNNGANSPELAGASEFLVNLFPLATVDVSKLAEYTYKEMGKRRAAIVYLDNATGVGAANLYKKVFEGLGGQVVAMESIRQDAVDATAQIAKVKAANPDVLHVHTLAEGAVVLKAAKAAGLNVPITSYAGVGEQAPIRKAAGDAINGLVYTSLSPDTTPALQSFLEAFKKRYNHDPTGVSYSVYMHDSPFLYAEAIKYLRKNNMEVNGANLKKAILAIRKFELPFVGTIEFRDDGTITLPVKLRRVKDFAAPPADDEKVTILQ